MKKGKLRTLPHLPSSKEENPYLLTEGLIWINKFVIDKSKEIGVGHKGDRHKLKDLSRLKKSIDEIKEKKGDSYDKATQALISLTQNHPFESANRRTAYFCAAGILYNSKKEMRIEYFKPKTAKTFIGIREGDYYSFEEVKKWIKTGEIKEYKRKN